MFLSAENVTEDRLTVVIHAERKGIENAIERPKNDIGEKKREDKNTAMRKNDDDGDFGKKGTERKTSSIIEKKQANLLGRAHHSLLKGRHQK